MQFILTVKVLILTFNLIIINNLLIINDQCWAKNSDEILVTTDTSKNLSKLVTLPDEILFHIFKDLSYRDIFPVSLSCKHLKAIMEDNFLWHHYLKKAELIAFSNLYREEEDYKKLFKFYATPSLILLDPLREISHIKTIGISNDGKKILGFMVEDKNSKKTFIYTQETGFQFLETPKGTYITPNAISGDGQTVIGNITRKKLNQPFKWNQEEGIQILEGLTTAQSVNACGKSIIGTVVTLERLKKPILWQAGEAAQILETLHLDDESDLLTISNDGQTVIGHTTNRNLPKQRQRFIWTAETRTQQLEDLGTGLVNTPLKLSANGKTIATSVSVDRHYYIPQAVIWTAENKLRYLNNLNTAVSSEVSVLSADGKVVIGQIHGEDPRGNQENESENLTVDNPLSSDSFWFQDDSCAAEKTKNFFRWTEKEGMHALIGPLNLKGYPILIEGFSLASVAAVSVNGCVMTGVGRFKGKKATYGYRLVVPKKDYF